MRAVLDTNVVVSALLWSGPPRQLLEAAREGRAELFTSMALLKELTGVLRREKFAQKIAQSALGVDQIVDRYLLLATPVRPRRVRCVIEDPDDDVVIGTALAARADVIVSGDAHLLALRAVDGIRIVTAPDALRHIS